MNILGYALLFIGMTIGVIIIPLGLPGAALILACVLVYAILTDFSAAVGWPFFIFLSALTIVAETADNWLTAAGAKRYGASTKSMWLSFVGGLLGAILIGSPLAIVTGPLGPVIGGFIGAFSIVTAYEYHRIRSTRDALRAGWGTLLGRTAGIVLKIVLAVTMIIAVAISIAF
jgi:uncharacterized protein YqgC (DUF456 family)